MLGRRDATGLLTRLLLALLPVRACRRYNRAAVFLASTGLYAPPLLLSGVAASAASALPLLLLGAPPALDMAAGAEDGRGDDCCCCSSVCSC